MADDELDRGREAFAKQRWGEAYRHLCAVQAERGLEREDLERLAIAAYLTGRDEASAEAWEEAHLDWLGHGEADRAARCAFWTALALLLRGDTARAGGWLARAARIVEGVECGARGYLLVPQAVDALTAGDAATAEALSAEAEALGERFGDNDLRALGRLGRGEAAIALGDTGRGLRLLDEVMVDVTTREVSPLATGIVYCAVIEACVGAFDLRRAAEWTEALREWCEGQPDLVPYRGQCMVHRSQVLQARGDWSGALAEAERARTHLSEPPHPALGVAWYQQAELHRLRGEFDEAERAYRLAASYGASTLPGHALLRLATGRVAAAAAAIRHEAAGTDRPLSGPVLAACVEILVAADDVEGAGVAAASLDALAERTRAAALRAMADTESGRVRLASADPLGALDVLRRACAEWRAINVPYEEARARVLTAVACRALDDADTAALELDVAAMVFERLGARPELERVAELRRRRRGTAPLTAREQQVLRLVAAGRTNREIGLELSISEHTVARHLQNVFTKLGLSSRAAATAYAYEHDVL